MAYDFDLIVIGAGSGGVRASRLAAMAGARVGVAEEFRVGGTCVIRGCVPKKLFVYGSEFRQAFKDSEGFGWKGEPPRFEWPILRDNVAKEVDRLSGIYVRNLENSGAELLYGRAQVTGPNSIVLKGQKGERAITTERILIATGGRPIRPPEIEGAEHAITSDDAFSLKTLPKHVVIGGGGYIAVEFATIFNGLGVDTCLVYRGDTVLRGFDDDVRTHVHSELSRSGVRVITRASFRSIEKTAAGFVSKLDNGTDVESDLVMLAFGRAPYTDDLGLETAGVRTGEHGEVIVDEYSRSSTPSIYAIGDVTNRLNLTPVAIREGQAFAETLYYDRPTAFDHADVPTAVFSRPPVGVVGLTEPQARKGGRKIDIYRTLFRPMKNIISGNGERTLMKLVVDAETQRVLGVHIAGVDGPEMIQLAAVAVKAGLTKQQWDSTCALHPTAAEELVTLREKYHAPGLPPE